MITAPFSPSEFMALLMFGGVALLVLVFVPVKIAAKIRRVRRASTHITCRICGYRYLLDTPSSPNVCPHCDSRN